MGPSMSRSSARTSFVGFPHAAPAGPPGKSRRVQEVTTYKTMTGSLLAMAERLTELGVTRVVMEATSDYWKPVLYVLEAAGFQTWLVNAKDVKHLPGRPKTDRLDAVWLCKVAERQMLRPSFVPPPAIRVLRDLTRFRWDQVAIRTAEKQRVEKLLEDAQIKLSTVVAPRMLPLPAPAAPAHATPVPPVRGPRAPGRRGSGFRNGLSRESEDDGRQDRRGGAGGEE